MVAEIRSRFKFLPIILNRVLDISCDKGLSTRLHVTKIDIGSHELPRSLQVKHARTPMMLVGTFEIGSMFLAILRETRVRAAQQGRSTLT